MAIYLEEPAVTRVSHHQLCLSKTQRQTEEEESLITKRKRKGFKSALIESNWHAKTRGGIDRRGPSF